MSPPIEVYDRKNKKFFTEKVYGAFFLRLLYGKHPLAPSLASFLAKIPWFSRFFGFWQTLPFTAKKIPAFVNEYAIDTSEFALPLTEFSSFNAFFCRHLKKEARPISPQENNAIIPADGRYRFFENISKASGFLVKGQKFCLKELLQDNALAQEYAKGSLVMARLCPVDYHRFHFTTSGIAGPAHLINGPLYSVNPIALKKNIHIFTQNKRVITELLSPIFGKILVIEVGATNVGSIHQTYTPLKEVKKGDEKGYFSFGGSSILLLFPPNAITFDKDLLEASAKNTEILCLMGQSLGQQKEN